MNKLSIYTRRAVSFFRGLLLFSIIMLKTFGATAQNEVSVTDAAGLKTALERTEPTTIKVTTGFDFEDETILGASHTLSIDNDQTITCNNGWFDVGDHAMTVNGAGTLICNRSGESITIGDNGKLILAGTVTVKITNPGNGSGIVVGGTLIREGSSTLNGESGGSISLKENGKVKGMNGMLKDQGYVLTSEEVTVGNANADPSATALSAGTYIWDNTLFAKAAEGWELASDGALTISSDTGMDNWTKYKNKNTAVCNAVKSVRIEDAVTKIVNGAFSGCNQITGVTIGAGVETIATSAFHATSRLIQLTIPASVTTIEEDAFLESGIESFKVTSELNFKTSEDHQVLFTYDGKTLVAYAPSNTLTGSYSIPEGVMTLKASCFKNRALSSVEIPSSITAIEEGAFQEARKLESVTFKGTSAPAFGPKAFDNCHDNLKIYVPVGSIESYKEAFNSETTNQELSGKIHTVSVQLTIDGGITDKLGDTGFWIMYDGNKYNDKQQFPLLVEAGKTITIASSCYELGKVKYGDENATQGSSTLEYTFTMPEVNTTIRIGTFSAKVFSIAYYDKDATGTPLESLSPSTFTVESNFPIDLPTNVMKTGYKFLGWKDTPDVSDAPPYLTEITEFKAEDLTFYAFFESVTITSLPTDTLKNLALEKLPKDVNEVIDTLQSRYATLTATLSDGKTKEVELKWVSSSSPFLSGSKDGNSFTWTATLPTGYQWDNMLEPEDWTGTITVTNPTVVKKDEEFTLVDGEVLTGDGATIAKKVTTPSSGSCTLQGVKAQETIILSNSATTLNLKGSNDLGNFTSKGSEAILQLESNAELAATSFHVSGGKTIIQSDDNWPIPSLSNVEPHVEGSMLIDSTGSIKKVYSADSKDAVLFLKELSGDQTITSNAKIILTLQYADGYTLTYALQIWNESEREWKKVQKTPPSRLTKSLPTLRWMDDTNLTWTVYSPGTYRIRIESKSGSTCLILHSEPFEITEDNNPPPTPPNPPYVPVPSYYTVTLPSVEGATTTPAAGAYSVEEYSRFSFHLTLDKEYDQSVPVVTTDRGKVLEPGIDGAYTIKSITDDVVISISGIMKNDPSVANAHIQSGSSIRSRDGIVFITVDRPLHVQVIALNGHLLRSQDIGAGESRISGLADGIYIVRLSDGTTHKVVIH